MEIPLFWFLCFGVNAFMWHVCKVRHTPLHCHCHIYGDVLVSNLDKMSKIIHPQVHLVRAHRTCICEDVEDDDDDDDGVVDDDVCAHTHMCCAGVFMFVFFARLSE